MASSDAPKLERPFPALTPAQRLHYEVYGYVVIENTLSGDLVKRLYDAVQQVKGELLATDDPLTAVVRGVRTGGSRPPLLLMSHMVESDPVWLEYLAHRRLLGMVEEIVGGTVRLEESEAIVNRRDPEESLDDEPRYRFHTGTRPPHGIYAVNGLMHCNFVKTLTNLTDLGPDDGGTVVIAGSHKVDCPVGQIIECAYEDRSLIHQVVAPAGSTLLFNEALIHATGQLRSDRERVIVVGGYTPTMFQAWKGQEPSAEFVATLPEHLKPLITGSDRWRWEQRHRTLDMPVDDGAY